MKMHHVGTPGGYTSWDQIDNCNALAPKTHSFLQEAFTPASVVPALSPSLPLNGLS